MELQERVTQLEKDNEALRCELAVLKVAFYNHIQGHDVITPLTTTAGSLPGTVVEFTYAKEAR